nr:hypothetical protein KPHV_48070 [Kitasatospora purpeofusca]
MGAARTAVITALGDMVTVHTMLADRPASSRPEDWYWQAYEANLHARNVLTEARNQLDQAIMEHDPRARQRTEAAHRAADARSAAAATRTTSTATPPGVDRQAAAATPAAVPGRSRTT